jgi:hypothetical protein
LHKRNESAIRKTNFISERMSYITLRSRWCKIIFLNLHVSYEDKRDDVKYSFYEEFVLLSFHFPRYYMKILLDEFTAKVGRENI